MQQRYITLTMAIATAIRALQELPDTYPAEFNDHGARVELSECVSQLRTLQTLVKAHGLDSPASLQTLIKRPKQGIY